MNLFALALMLAGLADADVFTFRSDVQPLFARFGCNQGACHGALSGKGGFRLSLRGDDPSLDWNSVTRDQFGRRIDVSRPDRSLLLLKATGKVAHEGGKRFTANSAPAKALARWIAHGAQDEKTPEVERLDVEPKERILDPKNRSQTVKVFAVFADGSKRDVTSLVSFDLSDPVMGAVSAAGVVTSKAPGDLSTAVRYRDARGVSRLTFPLDAPPTPVVAAVHPFDKAITTKLASLRLVSAERCDDSTFVRRAYLAAIGLPPAPAEASAFLADRALDKRKALAEKLVQRPEFADFWALKWADVLRNERKSMGAKGSKLFQDWLRKSMADDVPLDQFTSSLVSGTGSTWSNPPASFHRTNRDPTVAAESAGQVFLGVRIQCARCHNHPFDVWKMDDFYGFSAYFANVKRKEVDNKRKDDLDKHEINGDVVISVEGTAEFKHPATGKMLPPKPLAARSSKDAGKTLDACAESITRDPQFARNMANRIWSHLFGRGVVDPPDDFRDSNPPVNQALLDELVAAFEKGGRRTKPLVAAILASEAFSRANAMPATWTDATAAELPAANFAVFAPRLQSAEVMLDSVSQVLEVPESFPEAPAGTRAVQSLVGPLKNDFLRAFGKPERLLACECERTSSATLVQSFQMFNGEALRKKLAEKNNRLGRLLASGAKDDAILDELVLAALARLPTAAERRTAAKHLRSEKDRRKAWENLAWALLNSKEFLFLR
jgi:hypothetical protein